MDPRTPLVDVGFHKLLRPMLFRVGHGDPEAAHEVTMRSITAMSRHIALRAVVSALHPRPHHPITVAGITFPGPVGLAAGMDKYAAATLGWHALGFGHVELGTVTAHAQPGNDKPRLFRLRESEAVLNRMGFNNGGAAAMAARLEADGVRRGNNAAKIPIGISLGKTKATPLGDAVGDYLTSFTTLRRYADYVAINVSSPNTPGLRTLQDAGALTELVQALVAAAAEDADPVPIFVKVAPDLSRDALDELLQVCTDHGVRGLIATNTTLARVGLRGADARLSAEAGGLSGAPLSALALDVVRYVCAHTELPVIGVGGIMQVDDARAMFDAGASLVQVYTGYIYRGPALVNRINAL